MKRASAVIILLIVQCCLVAKASDSNFYAYYTKVDSDEPWEKHSLTSKHSDLVIQLPQGEIIFHRASSYLPKWVTDSAKRS